MVADAILRALEGRTGLLIGVVAELVRGNPDTAEGMRQSFAHGLPDSDPLSLRSDGGRTAPEHGPSSRSAAARRSDSGAPPHGAAGRGRRGTRHLDRRRPRSDSSRVAQSHDSRGGAGWPTYLTLSVSSYPPPSTFQFCSSPCSSFTCRPDSLASSPGRGQPSARNDGTVIPDLEPCTSGFSPWSSPRRLASRSFAGTRIATSSRWAPLPLDWRRWVTWPGGSGLAGLQEFPYPRHGHLIRRVDHCVYVDNAPNSPRRPPTRCGLLDLAGPGRYAAPRPGSRYDPTQPMTDLQAVFVALRHTAQTIGGRVDQRESSGRCSGSRDRRVGGVSQAGRAWRPARRCSP